MQLFTDPTLGMCTEKKRLFVSIVQLEHRSVVVLNIHVRMTDRLKPHRDVLPFTAHAIGPCDEVNVHGDVVAA